MLEIKNLCFSYKDEIIFDRFNFSIALNERLSILGQNGAGKSTLLKLIVGELGKYKGNIIFNNKNIKDYTKKELARLISYIPQTTNITYNFNVLDVVCMGRTPYLNIFNDISKEDIEIAKYYIEDIGISKLINKKFLEISGGERQLVLLAMALCQQSKIVILDEPTAHLDFGYSYKLIEKLYEINQKNDVGIIFTTHNPQHCFWSDSKTLIINENKILDFGKAEDVITSKNLSKIYKLPIIVDDKNNISIKGN